MFTDVLLDFALDFGSHSCGSLVPHAVEMGRALQQYISEITFVQVYSLYSMADHRHCRTTNQALKNHESSLKIPTLLLFLKCSEVFYLSSRKSVVFHDNICQTVFL